MSSGDGVRGQQMGSQTGHRLNVARSDHFGGIVPAGFDRGVKASRMGNSLRCPERYGVRAGIERSVSPDNCNLPEALV